jgi:hypothetical protein
MQNMLIQCSTSTLFVPISGTVIPSVIDSTATSAIPLTTTNASGQTVTTVPPPTITNKIVTTSDGTVYTITQYVHNPTGALDPGSAGGTSSNAFFNNTGAVAGTFVVVGLVVVGMIFALGLLCFRRRRRQRLDREVTAAAIAASSHPSQRSPLDEDGDVNSASASGGGGPTTSESYPSTVNHNMAQYGNYGASYGAAGGYDPYAAQGAGGGGYTDHPQGGYSDNPGGHYAYDAAAMGGAAGAAGGYVAGHGTGPGGYDSLQRGAQDPRQYYLNPNDLDQYTDAPAGYDEQGYHQDQGYHQQGYAPQEYGHAQGQGQGYNEDPYGGYEGNEGNEGSLNTPVHERGDPLHVSDRWSSFNGADDGRLRIQRDIEGAGVMDTVLG